MKFPEKILKFDAVYGIQSKHFNAKWCVLYREFDKVFEIILTYSSFITYKLLDYNKSTVPTAAIKTGLFDSAFVFEILSSYTE